MQTVERLFNVLTDGDTAALRLTTTSHRLATAPSSPRGVESRRTADHVRFKHDHAASGCFGNTAAAAAASAEAVLMCF